MNTKKLDNKIINLIIDRDKLLDKKGFRYGKFAFKWFELFFFSLIIGIIGFVYIHEIFGTELHHFLTTILAAAIILAIWASVEFYIMNRKLGALKKRWLNLYLSFFFLFVVISFTAVSMCFAYFDSTSVLLQNIKATYLFIIIPLLCTNFVLLFFWYIQPVYEIIDELNKADNFNL